MRSHPKTPRHGAETRGIAVETQRRAVETRRTRVILNVFSDLLNVFKIFLDGTIPARVGFEHVQRERDTPRAASGRQRGDAPPDSRDRADSLPRARLRGDAQPPHPRGPPPLP